MNTDRTSLSLIREILPAPKRGAGGRGEDPHFSRTRRGGRPLFWVHKGAQGCTSLHKRPFLRCGSRWNGVAAPAFRKPAYVNEHPPFSGHFANIQ